MERQAACLGQPFYLFIYTHVEWKGKQPAWGGLRGAALLSLYIYMNVYMYNGKGLHGASLSSPYIYMKIHMYNGKASSPKFSLIFSPGCTLRTLNL